MQRFVTDDLLKYSDKDSLIQKLFLSKLFFQFIRNEIDHLNANGFNDCFNLLKNAVKNSVTF